MNEPIRTLSNNQASSRNIKRNLNIDHLKEGIGTYIYTNPNKKINPNIFLNKGKFNKTKYKSKAYYITQRVLYPDKDIIKSRPIRRRILSAEKNSKNINDGIFQSFMSKTPYSFPVKRSKNINRSFDNLKREHDIFLRNKNEDCKVQRIFGVERKRINKNHNYESEIPKFKFSRKLFFGKNKNVTDIYV